MFNVTRPQSTIFLIIIAVMALLLLMLPSLSLAGSGEVDHQKRPGGNFRLILDDGQKTPRALAGIKPVSIDWYANTNRATRLSKTKTAEADMFFDIDREVTVDTDTVKGSAGVQINW